MPLASNCPISTPCFTFRSYPVPSQSIKDIFLCFKKKYCNSFSKYKHHSVTNLDLSWRPGKTSPKSPGKFNTETFAASQLKVKPTSSQQLKVKIFYRLLEYEFLNMDFCSKASLDGTIKCWKMSLHMAWGVELDEFKVPSNSNHLWLYFFKLFCL